MNDTEKLRQLYNCKIELTGEKLYMLKQTAVNNHHPFIPRPPYDANHPDVHHVENEVAIKMPEREYQRFSSNYSQFMDVLLLANDYPQIRDQYHQLLMLVSLLK